MSVINQGNFLSGLVEQLSYDADAKLSDALPGFSFSPSTEPEVTYRLLRTDELGHPGLKDIPAGEKVIVCVPRIPEPAEGVDPTDYYEQVRVSKSDMAILEDGWGKSKKVTLVVPALDERAKSLRLPFYLIWGIEMLRVEEINSRGFYVGIPGRLYNLRGYALQSWGVMTEVASSHYCLSCQMGTAPCDNHLVSDKV